MAEQAQWLHVFIDVAPDVPGDSARFWSAVLGWPVGAQWPGHPEFRSFTPPAGDPYIHQPGKLYPPTGSSAQLLLQRLGSDDPTSAVRAHIDLGTDDVEAEAERLVGLGAERLGPGRGWIVLRDPVGMVFCVTGNSPDDP